jgi:hypothetical protein
MPAPAPPIYGRVLPNALHMQAPPPPEEPPPPRRGGRKKGAPNKPKVTDEVDLMDLTEALREMTEARKCHGCQRQMTPMTWDLTRELVRSSRDRMADSDPETRGKLAETDLLYLGARLDGYCSLSCYRSTHG